MGVGMIVYCRRVVRCDDEASRSCHPRGWQATPSNVRVDLSPKR